MTLTKIIFVILHVITAAGWFGLGLRLGGQARLALTLTPSEAIPFAQDRIKSVRLMGIFIVLTFVFGLAAFLLGGGFAFYGPQYHTSLLLILILVGLHYAFLQPAWTGIQNNLSVSTGDRSVADSYRKRIAITMGIGHLIWLVVLILMFWTRIVVAA